MKTKKQTYIVPFTDSVPAESFTLLSNSDKEWTGDQFGKEFDNGNKFGDEWFSDGVKDYTDIWLSDNDS